MIFRFWDCQWKTPTAQKKQNLTRLERPLTQPAYYLRPAALEEPRTRSSSSWWQPAATTTSDSSICKDSAYPLLSKAEITTASLSALTFQLTNRWSLLVMKMIHSLPIILKSRKWERRSKSSQWWEALGIRTSSLAFDLTKISSNSLVATCSSNLMKMAVLSSMKTFRARLSMMMLVSKATRIWTSIIKNWAVLRTRSKWYWIWRRR